MRFISAILFIAMALGSAVQEQPYSNEWNKKSTLRSDRPLEFPGIVLEPGTYIIRLKESTETRAVVEICNQDESQVLGTVRATADHEARPDDNSEFVFFSGPPDKPEPVRTWFYSGDQIGWEFVYPKARAIEIAKKADTHVMASNSMNKDDVIVAVTPNGKEVVIYDPRLTQTAREKPRQ
jgi:hypothetical protein